MIKRVVVAFASFVILPATVFAQASLSGFIKDTSGGVLPGVSVEASSPVLIEKVRTGISDSTGLYRIPDLPPGIYKVTCTACENVYCEHQKQQTREIGSGISCYTKVTFEFE